MALLTHDRFCVVNTLTGAAIVFQAGETVEVPDAFVDECRQAGAYPAGAQLPAKDPELALSDGPELDDVTQRLVDGIRQLMATSDPELLTDNGTPRVPALRDIVGFEFTREQMKDALVAYHAEAGD